MAALIKALQGSLLLALWLVVLGRAPAAVRSTRIRPLWLAVALVAVELSFRLDVVDGRVDGWADASVSILGKDLAGIALAAGLLNWMGQMTRAVSPRHIKMHGAVAVAAGAVMTALFLGTPQHLAECGYRAVGNSPAGACTGYLALFDAYLALSTALAGAVFLRTARRADTGAVRLGLALVAIGCAAGMLFSFYRLAYVLTAVQGTSTPGVFGTFAAASRIFQGCALVLVAVGAGVPALIAVRRRLRQRCALRRLRPLWSALASLVPSVALGPVSGADAALRLHRRVVEIYDALLLLTITAPAGLYAGVLRATQRSGDDARDAAEATARWIHHLTPATDRSGPDRAADSDGDDTFRLPELRDEAEEVAWLCTVSRHYAAGVREP